MELVAGTSYSIRLCGLWSLSVAIRGALDWTADTKWAAASALNCENKYWIGLRCASQALSPIVICLGVHTGGSVCLGLKPPHVVAARFFSHWITLFEGAFNKTGCWIWGARIPTRFAHVITFPRLCSLPLSRMRSAQTASISRCLVETFVSELKERSLGWEDVGHSEEGGKQSTWDRLIWMFGRWRGTCSVANALFLHRDEGNWQCCAVHCTVVLNREWEPETGRRNKPFGGVLKDCTYRSLVAIFCFIYCRVNQIWTIIPNWKTAWEKRLKSESLTRSHVVFGFNELQGGL